MAHLLADIFLFEFKLKGSVGYLARTFLESIANNVWRRADNLNSLKKLSLLFDYYVTHKTLALSKPGLFAYVYPSKN